MDSGLSLKLHPKKMRLLFLQRLVLLQLITTSPRAHASSSPDHYFKPAKPTASLAQRPQEYIELTNPLPSDRLTPSCTHPIIHHSFGDTINKPPFSTPYSPPQPSDLCPFPWSHVTLLFSASSKGDQYDRISGLWLGGSELLRTSTAEPTRSGIFWNVRKDVTKYSYLFKQSGLNFTIMLENIVNSVYTGVYDVHVTLLFYNAVKVPLSNQYVSPPADFIIPLSSDNGLNKGFWFMIESESDIHSKRVRLPSRTCSVVLELYVSFHGNDEFWYSNPPNSYIRANNLTTPRGNGSYREVFVMLDGRVVGSVVPFPVVFTGGINPLFWEPVVAIGAFDLPSYDFDLTPVLGMLLDGNDHEFGFGISDGISYWLVDANLHLWLDFASGSEVIAKNVVYNSPQPQIVRTEKFDSLDGSFKIKAEGRIKIEGWVNSSFGNLTTSVTREFGLCSVVRFQNSGTYKHVKQRIRDKVEIRVINEVGSLISRVVMRRKYPLKVITSNLPGLKKDTYTLITNLSHVFDERYRNGVISRFVYNKQDCNGWMEVKDHDVLAGEASTNQFFSLDDGLCSYDRTVVAVNGRLVSDNTTHACPFVL